MVFDPRGAVFRISNRDDPQKYGTGFVIHTETSAPEKREAFILTCAHVVHDWDHESLKIYDTSAQLVVSGDKDILDLALIKVTFSKDRLLRSIVSTSGGQLEDLVEVHGFLRDRLVPLKARLNKPEDLQKARELRFYQFVLDQDEAIEPDNLEKGYSGSPIVLVNKGERVFAVANTRRASKTGKHKVGACIPVWQVVNIWPSMPDILGEQLFGNVYWPLLKKVRPQTEKITPNDYERAFRAACPNPDIHPADYSLWGIAVTLQEFENDSDSTHKICTFFAELGIPGFKKESQAVAAHAADQADDGIKHPIPEHTSQVYRQLIIRIVKRRASRRDDMGGSGGDRYWIEAHKVELDTCHKLCCDEGGNDCVPHIVRSIPTTYNRRTDEERRSALRELLQEEIQDIIASFGRHIPDLIQIVAPDELLTDLIVNEEIDQVLVREGLEPMADWRPTIFSGERLSNPDDAGRDLHDRMASDKAPLHGPVVALHESSLSKKERGLLKNAIVAVLATPEAVERLLPKAPYFVPFVLISEEKADVVVDKVKSLHCLRRIAHELYHAQYDQDMPERLPIISNTPNLEIHFTDKEDPVIVGN